MTATNTKHNAPDAHLYQPFESKSDLMEHMRDQLIGVDGSRLEDMLKRLSATHSGLWPDPEAVSN